MNAKKGHIEIRRLSKEIDGIVSAPYAVLFKNLSRILLKTDDDSLCLWTAAKECQIPPLVARILNALNADDTALMVLLRLIGNRLVRDEVIKQKPAILAELFLAGNEDHIHEAAISLCRYGFPEDFVQPIEHSAFVGSVLSNSRGRSLHVWIEETHNVMLSMSSTTLMTVSDATIQTCASLWNEAAKITDNKVFLRFVSIAAMVHRTYQGNEPGLSYSSTTSPEQNAFDAWATKCSRLFTGDKAPKIMRSILLRALYIVSNRPGQDNQEGLARLCMIKSVLNTMDQAVIRTASSDQELTQVLAKLAQKAAEGDVFPALRLCTCTILHVLDPDGRLWDITFFYSSFVQLLQHQLEVETSTLTDRLVLVQNFKLLYDHREVFQDILRDVLLHEHICTEVVQHLIDWCRPGMSITVEMMCSLRSATLLTDGLHHLMANNQLSFELLSRFATINLPDWWNWNFGSSAKTANCHVLETCCHAQQRLQKRLANAISDIMIMSASTTTTQLSGHKYKMLKDVLFQYEGQEKSSYCIWAREDAARGDCCTLDSSERQVHPKPQQDLQSVLSNISQRTLENVSQYVNDTCRDLQRRCEDVEVPLAAERAKSAGLQKELIDAQSANEIFVADQKARRVSWQHLLDIEQEHVAELKKNQTAMEQALEQAARELKEEAAKLTSAKNAHDELVVMCQSLRVELDQEKAVVQKCQEACQQMAQEHDALQTQMFLAQQKEQKMLCVLRGIENTV